MHLFSVPTMTCGHCAAAIEKAVKAVDPSAGVNVDLGAKTVRTDSSHAQAELTEAIREAGYEPSPAA